MRTYGPELELLATAVSHHGAGQLEEAGLAYRTVLAQEPNNIAAASKLSALQCPLQRPAEAERWARLAVEISPDAANSWNNLGRSLDAQNLYKQAKLAYQTCLRHDPAWHNLGLSFIREKIARLRNALALNLDIVNHDSRITCLPAFEEN